ncbi:MAG: maleylpyruvate isomerase family mycothiol-dependent enzyme [Acidimicrobiia bacterium]|nr:maleylpyruvate isomerase family mycothiol-dependent enzyme [Acidimicrobiia bacterium]
MSLPRTVTTAQFEPELRRFESLVRSVDAAGWDQPSRCTGWSAGDVAKHVVGQFADVAAGRFDGLGSDEATQREVDERVGKGPSEVADELAELQPQLAGLLALFDDDAWAGPAPGGAAGTLGEGVEALWSDMVLHADDIRSAIGQTAPADVDPKAAVSHIADVLTQRGWPAMTLQFDGLPAFTVSGGGEPLTGDAWAFALAATGRGNPQDLGLDESINIYA